MARVLCRDSSQADSYFRVSTLESFSNPVALGVKLRFVMTKTRVRLNAQCLGGICYVPQDIESRAEHMEHECENLRGTRGNNKTPEDMVKAWALASSVLESGKLRRNQGDGH